MQVYIRHIRAARLCMRGARDWFRRHDIDWSEFLAFGVAADTLIATGDPLALRAVEQARIEGETAHG